MCGIIVFLNVNAPPATQGWKGRAGVQSGNRAIFARCCRFGNDEPKHCVNLARSLFVQSNPCAEQVLRPRGGDSGAHGKGTKCNRSG